MIFQGREKMENKEIRGPDFLVIGTAKAGTYWVTGLLNSHPEIDCIPSLPRGQDGIEEGHIFDNLKKIEEDGGVKFAEITGRVHQGFFADLVPFLFKLPRKEFYKLFMQRYNEYCTKYRTKKILGEKTGEYLFSLDIIDEYYPEIKKLCILRDAKDRIVSWHFHQIRKGRIPESEKVSDVLMEYFVNRIKREYEALLNYPGKIHCFTYEDMTNNQKEIVKGILDYLEVDSNDEVIEKSIEGGSFKKRTSVSKESEKERERGEQSLTSHYRKGIVGDWKSHLTEKQVEYIREQLSELQEKVNEKFGLSLSI